MKQKKNRCLSIATFNTKINSSSSSIGTATLVGYGLLNYRWVFSAGRFLQSTSGKSNPPTWKTTKINYWRKLPGH